MSFENRSTDDLIRIASFGGGFVLDVTARSTDDLVRIASFAKDKNSKIILRGMAARSTDDLVRIASSGGGAIVFEG
ncbi:hypothetical protein [Brucella sp. 2280]|uniref:hypothetical protein n=1 Tax=Brucella sp. 2280 TaxID=2592625 RepID=UPI001295FDD7|nr:hypothetical protein [Brucella sp. 2280]QGA56865.1 hypothetical protein GHC20_07170 [Brucella sp. 2280]